MILIVSESDIGPKTSKKSRADIGHFYGQTLKKKCRETTSDKLVNFRQIEQ